MHDEARKLIWDARRAAERVERFVAGKSFEDYRVDDLLRSAVERQLEIVGEALNKLSRSDPANASSIPDLPRIVAFRNILVHGYATVDDRIVWGVIESKLGPLVSALDDLLKAA